jgi:hypothetical protein
MAESLFSSQVATPYNTSSRDFGQYSDHITVWIDQYIGEENTYANFKSKFDDNIQVLQSNSLAEIEIDDDSMVCSDPEMLKKLSHDVYCLKYFSSIDKALEYIHQNPDKKIFFISSGTIGRIVVPKIADLPQIHGIYIFCANISLQTDWAGDYADKINAMLEHQDDLLQRLTRDIADYLEKKGDEYEKIQSIIEAKNCYAWSKKLLIRAQQLGDTWVTKLIARLDEKLNKVQSAAVNPS